jgi:hypothetical protein
MLATLGWAAAGVLVAIAPSQAMWRTVVPHRGSFDGPDAWGRSSDAAADYPRFGVALWACAAALLVLAAVSSGSLRRRQAVHLGWAAAAIGVPSVLGGVLGTLVLYLQSLNDRFRGTPAQGAGRLRMEWGWCMWLSLAALLLSSAGTLLLLRALRVHYSAPADGGVH